MHCEACGQTTEGAVRCPRCGTRGPAFRFALLAALLCAFTGVASTLYVWKVIPTFAALFQGLRLELPLLTRLHIVAADWLGWTLLLGFLLAMAVLIGVRRLQRAMYTIAIVSVAALAFTLSGMLATFLSLAHIMPSLIRETWYQAQLQHGEMALLRGDLEVAARDLERAQRTDHQWNQARPCVAGYETLQLAEVRRAQGRLDEARKLYGDAVAQAERERCEIVPTGNAVPETAKARLTSLGTASPHPSP